MVHLNLHFSGGAEALFGSKKAHSIDIKGDVNIKLLIQWILDNLLEEKEKASLFAQNGTVRPGVLVLVNDVDWEITGGLTTTLEENDEVAFISTLHGG